MIDVCISDAAFEEWRELVAARRAGNLALDGARMTAAKDAEIARLRAALERIANYETMLAETKGAGGSVYAIAVYAIAIARAALREVNP